MPVSSFEPGQEMAIANFFLAIFCLFTIALPFLLITRADKTEANRNFMTATFNPWSQVGERIKSTPVILSDITPASEGQPSLEVISVNNIEKITESDEIISIENKVSLESEKSIVEELTTNDEVLAA